MITERFSVQEDWQEEGYDHFQSWTVQEQVGKKAWQIRKVCECDKEEDAHKIADLLNKHT